MVDMENIGIMGHSRGGEAVGHAAAFNHLTHYPDDATLTWDFGFDIKAVVAIAPVDGQYRPTSRLAPVENVNYLVFHGTHDGDVSSFSGLRTYKRVEFTDGEPHFKASVYVHRANHGQWNTVWGPHDRGARSGRSLDLRGLLEGEEQRQFALVYVTAFLEASLKGRDDYLPLFRDHRVVGGWLPKTMYITQFQESSFRPLATFEEDIDVTTGCRSRGGDPGGQPGDLEGECPPLPVPDRAPRPPPRRTRPFGWDGTTGSPGRTPPGWAHRPRSSSELPRPARNVGGGPEEHAGLHADGSGPDPGPRKDPGGGGGEGEGRRRRAGEGQEEGRGRGRREGWIQNWPVLLGALFVPFSRSREGRGGGREAPSSSFGPDWWTPTGDSGKVLLNRYGPVRRPIEIRIQRRDDQTVLPGTRRWSFRVTPSPWRISVGSSSGRLELSPVNGDPVRSLMRARPGRWSWTR